jgi:glycosyltransferase involved in cell wall biosynthesis
VFDWLDAIDIYVQPSRQEGLPRALIEAMSRGLPAFGARTGGIPELIDEKFLFSNTRTNIDEICSILRCFLNPKIRKEQALRNFEASTEYDGRFIEERRHEMLCRLRDKAGANTEIGGLHV